MEAWINIQISLLDKGMETGASVCLQKPLSGGFSDPRKEDWKWRAVLGPARRQVPEGAHRSLYLPRLNVSNESKHWGWGWARHPPQVSSTPYVVSQSTREPFGLFLSPDNGRKWQDLRSLP